MKVAIVLHSNGGLHGTGYATRVNSMIGAYVDSGLVVDVFHLKSQAEVLLDTEQRNRLRNYFVKEIERPRWRSQLHIRPPLVWAFDLAACDWSDLKLSEPYDVAQFETGAVWGLAPMLRARARVAVWIDDDAVRMRRFSAITRNPLQRAARIAAALKFHKWQSAMLRDADESWFVSPVEMDRYHAAAQTDRLALVPNGAADDLYRIARLPSECLQRVLFVGPMAHPANFGGIQWFARHVWPLVLRAVPEADFRLVGRGWSDVKGMQHSTTIDYVEDLGSELEAARAVVAPLFAGGGTKLKLVEAMGSARPVVATTVAAEGIPPSRGLDIADDPAVFAGKLIRWLRDGEESDRCGAENRAAVEDLRWSKVWANAVQRLEALVQTSAN